LTCAGTAVTVVRSGSWPIDVKGLGKKSKALFEHVEEDAIMIGNLEKADEWAWVTCHGRS
jgi:hypothetical protein